MNKTNLKRRQLLKAGALLAGAVSVPWLTACKQKYEVPGLSAFPDNNGLLLPVNCQSRVIARAGEMVGGSSYIWHSSPDGGGVFATEDGGWIYLSNSEVNKQKGGVGAIRFDRLGNIISAYPVMTGSSRNCGGCMTPWNTWLSCEEIDKGITWECDPLGKTPAIAREMLGVFKHESIAIDPETQVLYLTEDKRDGCFYRYVSSKIENGRADLAHGELQVAVINDSENVVWKKINDPLARSTATRKQVNDSAKFNGGEGIVYHNGVIYFDTKGDNRVWKYNIRTGKISIFYDASDYDNPILTGVDTLAMYGDTLLVCEDGGDMQIVAITPQKKIKPILQLTGQDNSEITGLAFSPDKTRLYFNSQRGRTGKPDGAITYEVTGKFI